MGSLNTIRPAMAGTLTKKTIFKAEPNVSLTASRSLIIACLASVGSAAIGALAEKPELLGRALIMIGLAEGIAIYGLIVSILILNRIL